MIQGEGLSILIHTSSTKETFTSNIKRNPYAIRKIRPIKPQLIQHIIIMPYFIVFPISDPTIFIKSHGLYKTNKLCNKARVNPWSKADEFILPRLEYITMYHPTWSGHV